MVAELIHESKLISVRCHIKQIYTYISKPGNVCSKFRIICKRRFAVFIHSEEDDAFTDIDSFVRLSDCVFLINITHQRMELFYFIFVTGLIWCML